MAWQVLVHRKVAKQAKKLDTSVRDALSTLLMDIEANGPVRANWPNYGKLEGNRHHCHIKKGHPTYVAIWEEKDDEIQLIEVTYAGTHEKAPY